MCRNIRDSLSELIERCESKFEGCRFAMVFVVRESHYDKFGRQRQRLPGMYKYSTYCEPSDEIPCLQYKLKLF